MSAQLRNMSNPQDRIILALDVPTEREALALVDELGDSISFYKIGLELLMAGALENLLKKMVNETQVFVDLKLPSDIPTTVERVVNLAASFGVRFLTLSNSATAKTIEAAQRGRGESQKPELLYVPFLSSLDREDFAEIEGRGPSEFEDALVRRALAAKEAGADGFIVSGPEISLLRKHHPCAPLVSPGIRPHWASTDDHKRTCTPKEAIQLGADYLVIGRPIHTAPDRKAATQRIVDEIAEALDENGGMSA